MVLLEANTTEERLMSRYSRDREIGEAIGGVERQGKIDNPVNRRHRFQSCHYSGRTRS